jgi:hypothetical protein
MHTVLMEGDTSIHSFDCSPNPVYASIDGETVQTTLDAHVFRHEAKPEWIEYKRNGDAGPDRKGRARGQLSAQAQAASLAGVTYRVVTEIDVVPREIEYSNWLYLCGCMNRGQLLSTVKEELLLIACFDRKGTWSFGELCRVNGADPALMLSAIAKLLASGWLTAEKLKTTHLSRQTLVHRTRGRAT